MTKAVKIRSSLLRLARYDASGRKLHVWHRSGRHLTYENVPADVVEGLSSDLSPGSFYVENIREKFESSEMSWALLRRFF